MREEERAGGERSVRAGEGGRERRSVDRRRGWAEKDK